MQKVIMLAAKPQSMVLARSQYLSRFCQQMQVFAQVASPHKQNTDGCVTLCWGAADPPLTAGSGGISSRIDS